ncbi:MAG: glycosyltransferase, partial [Gammaproteobacteria bacterium]|nr:glycosyltransferase [Gammaproteobacteria bacterium]
IKALEVDLVHIQTPFVAHYAGVKISNILDVPRVETYHTFFEEYLYHYVPFLPKKLMQTLARKFSRSQCNDVDAIVVPSNPMLEALRNYGITTNAEIIPTGINLDKFSHGDGYAFRKKHGISRTRPTLVHVGRVAFEKNIDFIIDALTLVKKQIDNVLLIIAGEGPAEKHLHKQVKAQGLDENVMFIGYLDRDTELKDCYCAGDAFVFASRTETQGLVLLEAMALGVPVVSTAIMGTKEILAPGMGALVPQDNIQDFSEKVITILKDNELRLALSTEARMYAKDWSKERFAERMTEFYINILKESGETIMTMETASQTADQ